MKKLLTVLAAVMAVAVSQFASAAVSVTISADKKTADFAFDASPLSRKLYLAYGNVDGGDSTNGWTFCSLLQTIPANTTALTGVTLPEGLGKTYRVMRAFLEKPMTAKDYVQTGLVALYDCRENVGWGMFDASATSWRNLVSDNRETDVPLLSGDSFGANDTYLKTGNGRVTTGAIAGADDNLTMEFNMKPPATSGMETWFAMVDGLGRCGFRGGAGTFEVAHPYNNNYYYRWFGDFPTDATKYHTYTARNFNKSGNPWPNARLDGANKNQTSEYSGGPAVSTKTYTLRLGAFNHALNLRSVRVYSCALTDAAIAQNRAVDVSRFEGGAVPLEASELTSAVEKVQVVNVNKSADGTPVSIEIEFPPTNIARKVCIGWGKQDAGDNISNWANAQVLDTAAANAVTMTVLVPAEIGAQLKRRGYRIFLGYTTARDYVQTGLVALYDCRENVGWGTFTSASDKWHNLVSESGETDLSFSSKESPPCLFETDNAHCARSIYRKTTSAAVTDGRSTHTLELNMKPNPANSISGAEQWFALVGGLGRVGFRSNTETLEVAYPQKKSGVDEYDYVWRWYDGFPTDGGYHTYTAQFGNPGSWPETWADGAKKNQSTSSYGWNAGTISDADYKFQLGLTSNKTDLELRSIRLYDKALTPDEVAHNRKVDVSRFEGGLPVNTVATDFIRTNWGLCITVY